MAASAQPTPGMTLGQILDRIFRLLWTQRRTFLKLAALPCAAMTVLVVFMMVAMVMSGATALPPHTALPAAMAQWILAAGLAGALLVLGAYAWFEGAATYTAIEADAGRLISVSNARARAWLRCGQLIWLLILRTLCIGLPILIPFAVVGALIGLGRNSGRGEIAPGVWFLLLPFVILLFAGAVVYAISMSLRLALAPAICMAEGVGGVGALKRSRVLTSKASGRLFLVLLVVYAAGYLTMMVVELAGAALLGMGALLAAVMGIRFVTPWNWIGITVLTTGGLAVLLVWMAAVWSSYAVAFAVVYRDQRFRLEGAS